MKINRQTIHAKYDGRCAYCGSPILLKNMQVDHIFPKCGGGTDDLSNLNPSCRRCNHYKRSYTLEQFRWLISTLHERISKQYIDKVAIDYGIITLQPWDRLFYFETLNVEA